MLTPCVFLLFVGAGSVGWSGPRPRTRTICPPRTARNSPSWSGKLGSWRPPHGSATSAEEPEPDRFTYAVTVQDHGQEHKARFSERSLPGEVRNLISWVGRVSGHEESIGSPGRAEN